MANEELDNQFSLCSNFQLIPSNSIPSLEFLVKLRIALVSPGIQILSQLVSNSLSWHASMAPETRSNVTLVEVENKNEECYTELSARFAQLSSNMEELRSLLH